MWIVSWDPFLIKIIFKYVNNTMRPIFNEKVADTYCLQEKSQQLRLKKKTQVLNADTNKLGPNGQLITTLFVLLFSSSNHHFICSCFQFSGSITILQDMWLSFWTIKHNIKDGSLQLTKVSSSNYLLTRHHDLVQIVLFLF